MSELDLQLDRLRQSHRATARYSIYRTRLAEDGYTRVQEPLPYIGLTFDEAQKVRMQLDQETRQAAGNPMSSWGLTIHGLKLETLQRRSTNHASA